MYIVTQVCLGTDTGTGVGATDYTDPQVVSGLGDEFVEGSSLQQTEQEFSRARFSVGQAKPLYQNTDWRCGCQCVV